MLLASVAEVREALGFDDMTDINASILECLKASEPILASRLGVPTFAAQNLVDLFYAARPGYKADGLCTTEFRLRTGFVTALTKVETSVTNTDWSEAVDITADVLKDLEKGIIRDVGTDFFRTFVRVTYTAGFPADGVDPDSYDLDFVPAWLQEAAKLRATIMLNSSPALEQANIKIDIKPMSQNLAALVAGKTRYAPVALLPL